MAAPITHLVFAQHFLKKYTSYISGDFIIGTSFPDIRYLKVIDRDLTHPQVLGLESVLEERDSFRAGLLFHVRIDEIREKFVLSSHLYEILVDSPYITQSLKIVEDIVLYDKLSNSTQIAKYFDKIHPSEIEFDIPQAKIEFRHSLLSDYVSKKPDEESIKVFVSKLGLPNSAVVQINNILSDLLSNDKVLDYIDKLYTNISNYQ